MEFTATKEALAKALTTTKQALGDKDQHEILQNVLICAGPDGVVFETTNMGTRISYRVPAEVKEHGVCLLGHKALVALLKAAPKKSEITLARGEGVIAGNAVSISYNGLQIKIDAFQARDFPAAHVAPTGVEVPAAAFCGALHRVLFSACKQASRVNLGGVLVESTGSEVTTVSTDGHRLTRYRTPLAIPALPKGILVPLKAAKALAKHRKAKGSCTLAIDETHLTCAIGAVTYQIKIPHVTFPPYNQVIPTRGETFRTQRAPLLAALKSVQPLAPSRTQTVILDINETKIRISVDNPDVGKAEKIVPFGGPAKSLRLGFNVGYLIDALEATGTKAVDLRFIGELDPVVVEPVGGDDLTCVVMPMRV